MKPANTEPEADRHVEAGDVAGERGHLVRDEGRELITPKLHNSCGIPCVSRAAIVMADRSKRV
jgi:hypothetical protein